MVLLSLATALPPHRIGQEEAKQVAARLFGGRTALFDRLSGVFDNAGIGARHLIRPPEWYETERGWEARNAAYLDAADTLYAEAAGKALAAAGVAADAVDCLVTVSTTGIATPSLEARAAARMGFRADAERVPVFGLGCAGGVTGLALAARLAAERPGKTVLFVTVELCSVAMRLDKLSKANIVATALFGDGAAAALVRSGEGGGLARIGAGAERLWPGTLGIMGWDVEDPGLGVVFDRAIPPFIEAHLAEGVRAIEDKVGEARAWCCHPGGAKVIEALEASLGLAACTLADERAVLRDHGNMSAPTVLFVLERLLARGLSAPTLMLALGPGFTLSGLMLEPVR
ncbi:MAG: type III polyketide synthase [Allosphingosinicella sp.]|uniref:type III polyketide synthase n=1 Tax=Allosphingosinicella sp. TaxID=2823234 RepID=UPI003941E8ED